eukprot:Opistho-1_new@40865
MRRPEESQPSLPSLPSLRHARSKGPLDSHRGALRPLLMGGSAKRPRSSRTSDMIGHHSAGVAQSGKSCILDDRARRRLKTELYGQSSADADRRPGGSRPVRMLSRGLSGSNSACSSRANTPDIDLDTDKDKEVFRVNHFARVPEEIIVRIMRLLGPGDLLRTAQVCRQWRRIAHDRAPWQRLVLGKWPLCSPEMYSGDWRRMFLDGNSLGGRADLTWRVEKFRELSVKSLYSHSVVAGGFPWRLFLFPRGVCACACVCVSACVHANACPMVLQSTYRRLDPSRRQQRREHAVAVSRCSERRHAARGMAPSRALPSPRRQPPQSRGERAARRPFARVCRERTRLGLHQLHESRHDQQRPR